MYASFSKYRISTKQHFVSAVLFIVLLAAYIFLLFTHIKQTSATFDEPYHILAGYQHWQCQDFGINPEHPPLLKLLSTFPLTFLSLAEGPWLCGAKILDRSDGFTMGAQFLAMNGVDPILIPARIGASLFAVLLALLVFVAARKMFGLVTAFLALTLFVFEPNLIAHGSLVTTDMAITFSLFVTIFFLYQYCHQPNTLNLVFTGFGLGLMLAAKHSGLLMLPVPLLLLLVDFFLFQRKQGVQEQSPTTSYLRAATVYIVMCILALVVLWAVYGFRYQMLPVEGQTSFYVIDLLRSGFRPELAESHLGRAFDIFHRRVRLVPESYLYGLLDIIMTSDRKTTLFGVLYPTGQWFYFPIVFTIKTSVALLLLILLALLTPDLYRRYSREMLFVLLPPAVYLTVTLTSGINIGVRHILPIYPFLVIAAAAGGYIWAKRSKVVFFGLFIIVLNHAFVTITIAPDFIPFANGLWGGIENTHKLLGDSNVDWGQNLKLVESYVIEKNIEECWLAYSGMGELARMQSTCRLLPAPGWTYTQEIVESVPETIEGVIFLSTQVLPPYDQGYGSFLQVEPITLIGGSIFVYKGRFDVPFVSSTSYADRCFQQLREKLIEEALISGAAAVNADLSNPNAHLCLGLAMVRDGMNEEARRELEAVIELTQAEPELWQGVRQRTIQTIDFLDRRE